MLDEDWEVVETAEKTVHKSDELVKEKASFAWSPIPISAIDQLTQTSALSSRCNSVAILNWS
jgi:hypothetical protein